MNLNFRAGLGASLTGLLAVNLSLAALPLFSPVELVNERRFEHGCGPLAVAPIRYRRAAREWARQMRSAGEIFHSQLQLEHWAKVGEVIGVGRSVKRIIRALFHSAPHRAILLDCEYDLAAFGFIRSKRVWLVGRLYSRLSV